MRRAAEDWVRGRGQAKLTLSVFKGTSRARTVYERRGDNVETIRYEKTMWMAQGLWLGPCKIP